MNSNKPIVLDTCVLVDFLRGHKQAVSFVLTNQDAIILSSIVIAELHAGARDENEVAELRRLPILFPTASVSVEIASLSGMYMRRYYKSHGLGLADAVLAATATSSEAILKTLNVRNFPMFDDLKPAYVR